MSVRLAPEQVRLVAETVKSLEGASACNGDRGSIVAKLAETLGVSMNTAYVYLKKYGGWQSFKKARSDKGTTGVSRELCQTISGMILEGTRRTHKQILSLNQAIQVLHANGENIVHSAETIRRAATIYGVNPGRLKKCEPAVRVRSLYPNHVWQVDASVCVLYYLKGKAGLKKLDEAKYNEKKPEELEKIKKNRVVRYVVTDHASGAFYVRYENAPGESAQGILQTLIEFMSDRGNHDPVHGLPDILYSDNGSGLISSLVKGFCEKLNIRALTHRPKNAKATGSVEKSQDIVERGFESRLRFLDITDIASLQEAADRWRRHFLATAILKRTGKTRNGAWLTIPEKNLRTVPEDVLRAIAAWQDERRVVPTDFAISVNTRTSFGTRKYDLRDLAYHGLGVKDSVRVELNPFSAPDITVIMAMPDGSEKRFNVKPIEFDQYGQSLNSPVFGEEYKSLPKTQTEKTLDEIRMRAYGAETPQEAEKAAKSGKKPFADIDFMADVKEAPTYLGRKGSQLNIAAKETEEAPMSRVAFAMMMKRKHPEVWNDTTAAACMEALGNRYPEYVPGTEIDKAVGWLSEKFGPRRAAVLSFEGRRACAQ